MPVTVKDLISQLQRVDPTLVVCMSKDEEGNGFTEFSGDFSFGRYDPNNWDDVFSSHTYELDEDGDPDWNKERPITDEEANAICLWP